jgi:hypothetical protein
MAGGDAGIVEDREQAVRSALSRSNNSWGGIATSA